MVRSSIHMWKWCFWYAGSILTLWVNGLISQKFVIHSMPFLNNLHFVLYSFDKDRDWNYSHEKLDILSASKGLIKNHSHKNN